jgi:hypothetical protein
MYIFIAIPSFLIVGAWLGAFGCRSTLPAARPEIEAYFDPIGRPDTLRFEISDDGVEGDTIPNSLFFKKVDQQLLREIDYLADSAQATVLARGRFALAGTVEAYWVDIRQFWFQHQSLLLYDRGRGAFTGRITVAEWYGGEGGQVRIGSALYDHDGDGDLDLLRKNTQFSLVPEGEEMRETKVESSEALIWDHGRFLPGR